MDIPKLIILLCCTYSLASEHSHIIPVENYETELQVLGQDVLIPETPVKVIKITKTVAVKIPVPYPVKVIEKVPYPVHVAKPYPVPVTQIVHVPQPAHPQGKSLHTHESLDISKQRDYQHYGQQDAVQEAGPESNYQVHETPSHESSYNRNQNNFGFGNDGHSSYDSPINYYRYNDDNGPYESKKYEQILKVNQRPRNSGSLRN